MIERVYMFSKHHEFCRDRVGDTLNSTWPPMSARKVLQGAKNEGCDEVCAKKGDIKFSRDLICHESKNISVKLGKRLR